MTAPVITFLGELGTQITATRQAAEGLAQTVETMSRRVATSAEQARTVVVTVSEEIGHHAGKVNDTMSSMFEETRNQFNDLLYAVANANIDFEYGAEIREAVAAVQAGLMDLRDFAKDYGKYKLEIGGELKSVKEILDGMDLRHYEKLFQEYITGLRTDAKSLEETLRFLEATQSKYVTRLLEMIEAFRAGQMSLEVIEDAVKNLKKAFPGQDLGYLMDEILDELKANSASHGGGL